MALSLAKLIARTQASIDGETDPKKFAPLQASLAAYLATKAAKDEEDGPDSDEDESKAKKAAAAAAKAKGKAEAAKHRAKAAEHKAKAAESEEAAKKCEEGDEEESESESEEAAAALVTGDHAALLVRLSQSVDKIERAQIATSKATLIGGARRARAITAKEETWLASQSLAVVESFLEQRASSHLVITSEDDLVKAKSAQPGTEASLSAEALELIDNAVAVFPGDKKAFRATMVEAHLAAHKKALAAAGGGSGRY